MPSTLQLLAATVAGALGVAASAEAADSRRTLRQSPALSGAGGTTLSAAAAASAAAEPKIVPGSDIPSVIVDAGSTTVSGISSGAYMAVQMHVAYSLTIKGAGVLAGGPYWCAQDNVLTALGACMQDGSQIDVGYLYSIMQNTALWGFADPLDGLYDDRVWILSARNDTVVAHSVVQATQALYGYVLQNPSTQLRAVYNQLGEHSQLTTSYGSPCVYLGSPYINGCDYDAAGEMLQWVYNDSLTPPTAAITTDALSVPTTYGAPTCKFDYPTPQHAAPSLNKPSTSKIVRALPVCSADVHESAAIGSSRPVLRAGSGTMYEFDQGVFLGGGAWSDSFGLAQTAFVYIPDACLASNGGSAGCLLHTAFHGCLQTQDNIGQDFVLHAGFLPWADANNMVVLFPQAIANLLNPKGCFDWWGYAGTAYASNYGTQTLTVKRMLDVLSQREITPNRSSLVGAEEHARAWSQTVMGGAALPATPVRSTL